MDTIEVLRKSDLFRGLNDEQLRVLEKMATPCVFEPGTIINKQDTKLDNVYLIEEGLVAIFLELGPLTERQLQAASNFETFGWSAMIEPHISTATAKAIEKTKALAFNGKELCDLCITQPELGCRISRAVARVVAARLHSAYNQLLGVTHQD